MASLTARRSWTILYLSDSPLGVLYFTGNRGVLHGDVQGIRASFDTMALACFEIAADWANFRGYCGFRGRGAPGFKCNMTGGTCKCPTSSAPVDHRQYRILSITSGGIAVVCDYSIDISRGMVQKCRSVFKSQWGRDSNRPMFRKDS